MRGREFLDQARESLPGTLPRHRRSTMIHAYYALLLECRDAMARWRLPALSRQQVHTQVRLRLTYSTEPDLKGIGLTLEELGQRRNLASYVLWDLLLFTTAAVTQGDVKAAVDAIDVLDAIDGDPARRTAANACIRPQPLLGQQPCQVPNMGSALTRVLYPTDRYQGFIGSRHPQVPSLFPGARAYPFVERPIAVFMWTGVHKCV